MAGVSRVAVTDSGVGVASCTILTRTGLATVCSICVVDATYKTETSHTVQHRVGWNYGRMTRWMNDTTLRRIGWMDSRTDACMEELIDEWMA